MKVPQRVAAAYAGFVVRHPAIVLSVLAVLTAGAIYGTSRLGLNTNQLDLISQDLQQVKDVERVVDMVGGTGYLMMALRSDDTARLKAVADDLAKQLQEDKQNVRFLTYKLPVDFIQENMVLFVGTEDLQTARERINKYIKATIRAANPFSFDLGAPTKREPPRLEIDDIVDKYSRVGKRSILDEYNLSQDGKMLLILVKPMWNAPELGRTEAFLNELRGRVAEYSRNNPHGVTVEETYRPLDMKDGIPATGSPEANLLKAGKPIGQVAPPNTITYGFTGSYKTILDDSVAVRESLKPTTVISFLGILAVMIAFFRKALPIFIIASGTVLGTVITIGFAWATVGELNMITSMLGAILMGLGVDFGFHFTYRTRLELGSGKPWDVAIRDAMVNSGVPAFISAIATSGAFFALLFSGFRGFSQFGFLAGFGTFIIGATLFSWAPALLAIIGHHWPQLVPKLVGVTPPPRDLAKDGHQVRIPKPKIVIGVFGVLVALMGVAAMPLGDVDVPRDRSATLWERIQMGTRFNYNTRALVPEDQPSVLLQDEINVRFNLSSDPIAVYTRTLDEARKVYDEFPPQLRGAGAAAQGFGKDFSEKLKKYSTVDQVVSVFTFVPPPELAKANAQVLAEWKAELEESGITPEALPPELQERGKLAEKILSAQPYGVEDLPKFYRDQFQHLPTTRPENHGWLTFLYPTVDLYDGKNMMLFAAQTEEIRTDDGSIFRSAGLPILYATLAKIVLFDGKVTVALTAVWLLLILLIDFRSIKLALAALIPLSLGMGLMFGVMVLVGESLNFMNICVLPIVLGYGVSHGVYLLHRFQEGTSPIVALRSVGAAVASSTLTTVVGFGALLAASHNGLKSLGVITCIGLVTTLFTSFTLLGAVLQLMHDRRVREGRLVTSAAPSPGADRTPAEVT